MSTRRLNAEAFHSAAEAICEPVDYQSTSDFLRLPQEVEARRKRVYGNKLVNPQKLCARPFILFFHFNFCVVVEAHTKSVYTNKLGSPQKLLLYLFVDS